MSHAKKYKVKANKGTMDRECMKLLSLTGLARPTSQVYISANSPATLNDPGSCSSRACICVNVLLNAFGRNIVVIGGSVVILVIGIVCIMARSIVRHRIAVIGIWLREASLRIVVIALYTGLSAPHVAMIPVYIYLFAPHVVLNAAIRNVLITLHIGLSAVIVVVGGVVSNKEWSRRTRTVNVLHSVFGRTIADVSGGVV